MNDGNEIPNELIYGTIKGYKVNRETNEKISGALFGLFRADETSFTKAMPSYRRIRQDGIFIFENVAYGSLPCASCVLRLAISKTRRSTP